MIKGLQNINNLNAEETRNANNWHKTDIRASPITIRDSFSLALYLLLLFEYLAIKNYVK